MSTEAIGEESPVVGGRLGDPAVGDVIGALDAYRSLELEREGIGMFLALHDARPGRVLQVQDEVALTEGAHLAQLFDGYWQRLEGAGFPVADAERYEPDETGARELIHVLVVLSASHLTLRPAATRIRSRDGGGEDDGHDARD